MSYFVFFCCLFIYKQLRIIYLGLGDRADLSAIVNLLLCGLCSERCLPLGAFDGSRYFVEAFPGPSI